MCPSSVLYKFSANWRTLHPDWVLPMGVAVRETVETVLGQWPVAITQLKLGVNEKKAPNDRFRRP